jgi:hypothetical protein
MDSSDAIYRGQPGLQTAIITSTRLLWKWVFVGKQQLTRQIIDVRIIPKSQVTFNQTFESISTNEYIW